MKQIIQFYSLLFLLIFLLASCASSGKGPALAGATTGGGYISAESSRAVIGQTILIDKATDSTYGYKPENPIKVGGILMQKGPEQQRRFLNALRVNDSTDIEYYRSGSCCFFDTPNAKYGRGLLDVYAVRWKGHKRPIYLYLNMYDEGPLYIPFGFTRIGSF